MCHPPQRFLEIGFAVCGFTLSSPADVQSIACIADAAFPENVQMKNCCASWRFSS